MAAVLGPVPAFAHGGDPTLVPTVRAISPALPVDVVVQVRTTVSEQMIVANPTTTPLQVLDPAGVPFLRIARSGIDGNVNNPYFHRSLNPPGVPPRLPESASSGAKARWVPLSKGESWGWFEPRLHPFEPGTEPAAGAEPSGDLTTWQVGLRYGSQSVRVDGVLERRTVTGSFFAQPDPRSDGLAVTVGQGSTPAVLLVASAGQRVAVEGRDGKPFLRLDDTGAFANTGSTSFRDNPDFTDAALGKRGQKDQTGWVRIGAPGRIRWLDPRLQYEADRPPTVVERAAQPAQLARWEIPVTVDGAAAPLRGTLSWVPSGATVSPAGDGSDFPWVPVAVGAVVALGGAALALSRGRVRRAAG